jgi:hypothetical protein
MQNARPTILARTSRTGAPGARPVGSSLFGCLVTLTRRWRGGVRRKDRERRRGNAGLRPAMPPWRHRLYRTWSRALAGASRAPAWQPPARTPLARSKPRAPGPSGVVFAGVVSNRQIKKISRERTLGPFVSLAPSRPAGATVRLASRVLIISRSRFFHKEIVRMTLKLSQFGTNGSRWHETGLPPIAHRGHPWWSLFLLLMLAGNVVVAILAWILVGLVTR